MRLDIETVQRLITESELEALKIVQSGGSISELLRLNNHIMRLQDLLIRLLMAKNEIKKSA